jgi:hypothetical protein
MHACRWGNGPPASQPLARYGVILGARSRAACSPARRSSLKLTVSKSTESGEPAPSIIEGRLWTTMRESTCHWNVRCRCDRQDCAAGQGCKRAWSADCVVRRARLRSGAGRAEAGSLSQWLHAGLKQAGLAVDLLETRARARCVQGDAGEVRPQRCARDCPANAAGLVSAGALQVDGGAGDAAVLTARKLVHSKRHDVEMSLRGILRGFGLKVARMVPTGRRMQVGFT